jgi:Skp family chaperone for outer membrane proteins
MRKLSVTTRGARAAAAIAFTLIAGFGLAPASAQPKPGSPPSNAGVPAPKILVIDRNAILRASKVGQDIVRQVNSLTVSAENEFKNEGQGLQREGQALQQQVAILAPDVKARKIRDFQAKQVAFQRKVEARQGLIQGGVFQARQKVEAALGPILQGIMQERGANLLLDRAAVVLGTVNVDVTSVAVQRLDQKMPSIKIGLAPLPPALQQQMMMQQAQRR